MEKLGLYTLSGRVHSAVLQGCGIQSTPWITIVHMITLSVELEQEDDGRWIAEVTELPGVLAYGENPGDARAKAQALALRVFADRLEHGEAGPDLLSISFKAA